MAAKNQPKKYFDVVTYTGNGTEQTVLGLQFSPGLVWIKGRSEILDHRLVDVVRGQKQLKTSRTDAESSFPLTFNEDGFVVTDDGNEQNKAGTEYVAWCWNAGDTTKTIAVGELNSDAYDQSQVWSSSLTGTFSNGSPLNVFGGSGTANGVTCQGNSMTFAPVGGLNVVSSFAFYYSTSQTTQYKINGGEYVSLPSTSGDVLKTIEFTGTLNSFEWNAPTQGELVNVYEILVDGRILVDTSVTPPNVPSVETTVRASQESGFSVVSWTGNGSPPTTISHGLLQSPKIVILKDRDLTGAWVVGSDLIGWGNRLELNTTAAASSAPADFNSKSPTPYVFTTGSNQANTNSKIAYCLSEIPGYSSIGSYTGTGGSGPFLSTGFEPSFILIKRIDDVSHWWMYDNKRNGYNPENEQLTANIPDGEYDAATYPSGDFLSNGFKISNTSNERNLSGASYIYMAFSQKPSTKPTLEKVEFAPDIYSTWDRKQYDFAVGDTVEQVGTTIRETGDVLSVTTNSNGSVTLVVTNDVGTFDIGDVLTQNAQTGTIIGLDEETNSIIVIPD